MNIDSPELAYLIATERQQQLVADAATPPSDVWREVVGRLKTALSR